MRLEEIDQGQLRLLERMGDGERWVLSAFVRFDLAEVPNRRARSVELDSGLDQVEERLRTLELDEPATAALESCLKRIRKRLEEPLTTDPGVHGVALFCEDGGELHIFALRRPSAFDLAASFRQGPALEPLIEALPGPRWGVASVSHKHGRVLRGSDIGLVEVGDVEDDVHRRHSQGGWSQARYQRGIEKETRDHVQRVCDLLFALHELQPFDSIVVLGPPEIWPLLEKNLHPYLQDLLVGHLPVDLEHASAAEVLERVRGLMEKERRELQREAIERLAQGLGKKEGAVAGTTAVLAAIEDHRVETLLVSAGARDAQIEQAVEGAVSQAADVLVIETDELEPYDKIAALLRY